MQLSHVFSFLLLVLVPVAVGNAEDTAAAAKKEQSDVSGKVEKLTEKNTAKNDELPQNKSQEKTTDAEAVQKTKELSHECIASEALIVDLEEREKKLKQKEAELIEREKELTAEKAAVNELLGKIDGLKSDQKIAKAKASAEQAEKVSKLVEMFEGMSPKAAASIMSGLEEDLAVNILTSLSSVKAGKILANLTPSQSSKLSENLAYGKKLESTGKERSHGESHERSPASSER